MNDKYSIEISDLTKVFGSRIIFDKINFRRDTPGLAGIAGPNGSGKSTLVKVIAGLLTQSSGTIKHYIDGKEVQQNDVYSVVGFASPYVYLYDEFSALENLEISMKIRGLRPDHNNFKALLDRFTLWPRRKDPVKAYSSGMKQRLKLIFSVIHSPALIIWDEPTANLDSDGKSRVYELAKELSATKLVVFATNEETEIGMCSDVINILDYKNNK